MSDKKAVNYTDLYIAKNYIDDAVNNLKTDISDTYYQKTDKVSEASIADKAAADLSGNLIVDTYLKKNDPIENANKVNGIAFTQTNSGLVKIGENTVTQKKILWQSTGSTNEGLLDTVTMRKYDLGESIVGKKLEVIYRFYPKEDSTLGWLGFKTATVIVYPAYSTSGVASATFTEVYTVSSTSPITITSMFLTLSISRTSENMLGISMSGSSYADDFYCEIYEINEILE